MKKRIFCEIEGIGQFKKYCQHFAIRKNTWFFLSMCNIRPLMREDKIGERGRGKEKF